LRTIQPNYEGNGTSKAASFSERHGDRTRHLRLFTDRDSSEASRSASVHPAPEPNRAVWAASLWRDGKGRQYARKSLVCAFPNGLYDLLFIEMPLKSSIISRWGYLLDATERKM